MNPPPARMKAIENQIDLLVDGELTEEERASLLRRLEEEADGWKRCALGFLEAQTWREAMEDRSAEKSAGGRRRWVMPLTALAAVVLGFVAALGLVKPSAGESAPIASAPALPVEPEVRLVPYPVVEHTGFVPASDETGNMFYQTRGDVPEFFLQALREAGHDVKHVERVVDLPVENGEPLQLPITETRVFVRHQL